MYIVKTERNCLGDTRTATHMPTREEFEEANESHCDDVAGLVGAFCTELFNRAQDHDWTKLVEPYATMFYNEMKSTIEEHREFTGGEWYRLHSTVLERHHLLERCPEDVTLFDVIEMLCDCVAAGMARTGHVYPIVLPDEILQKAVSNTVDYLVKHIEVVDRKTENGSEKPNNCERITEDGVTCAKYPACDDCLDNPLNKVKGSERLVKGSEKTDCLDRYDRKTEPTISKMEQVDEPQTERSK